MVDTLFTISTNLAMAGWLLLILVPYWKWTKPIVQSGLIPILLSVVYLYLIVTGWGAGEGGFGSIDEIRLLFADDRLLVAGWVHYLAFDLWLGSWEAGDARKNDIHRLILLPCQLLTFFFGPIGLLLYIIIRSIKTKSFIHYENFTMAG